MAFEPLFYVALVTISAWQRAAPAEPAEPDRRPYRNLAIRGSAGRTTSITSVNIGGFLAPLLWDAGRAVRAGITASVVLASGWWRARHPSIGAAPSSRLRSCRASALTPRGAAGSRARWRCCSSRLRCASPSSSRGLRAGQTPWRSGPIMGSIATPVTRVVPMTRPSRSTPLFVMVALICRCWHWRRRARRARRHGATGAAHGGGRAGSLPVLTCCSPRWRRAAHHIGCGSRCSSHCSPSVSCTSCRTGLGLFARLAPAGWATTVAAWYLATFAGRPAAGAGRHRLDRAGHDAFLLLAGLASSRRCWRRSIRLPWR